MSNDSKQHIADLDAVGKWSIRFYTSDRMMPVQTHDGGNHERAALLEAGRLSRHPGRAGMTCVVVNTRPTRQERADYERGESYLRWLLMNETKDELEFIGITPDLHPCRALADALTS